MNDFVQLLMKFYKEGKLDKSALVDLLNKYKNMPKTVEPQDIAIVGLSCRMPEAKDIDAFWHNLSHGVNSVRSFPKTRSKDIDPLLVSIKEQLKSVNDPYWVGGFLDEVDGFDNEHFQILPADATIMDPQQRIFLELAHEAFEDAGCTKAKLQNTKTGVFVGDVVNEYHQLVNKVSASAVIGNISPFIASRVSYYYDLKGPTINVSTTCSTALVAVHVACQSLLSGECDIALSGAMNLRLFPFDLKDDPVDALGITTPNGACRAFDANADGVVRGEGGGAIVLKRYQDAVRDNNTIYAVIKSSGVNNDGKSSSPGAPNPLAQAELLKQVWQKSGIDPRNIGYIESHGTGTKIGDPIEVQGITQAFSHFTSDKQFCGIGSIKTNIGHLTGGASGLSGLIKTVLCIKHRKLVPTLHFSTPNPLIDFPNTPLYVCEELLDWTTQNDHLIAGVSAFGFNGTNCHVLLESPPTERKECVKDIEFPIIFSHHSKKGLSLLLENFCEFLKQKVEPLCIQDISYTLLKGRDHYSNRVIFLTRSCKDLLYQIKEKLGEDQQISLATCLEELKKYDEIFYSAFKSKIISLPKYPFDRKRFWLKSDTLRTTSLKKKPSLVAQVVEKISDDIPTSLIELFQEIMGLEEIQINDNFFDLGGDSLLGVEIINEIHKRFDKKVSYNDLFSNPVIGDLAELLEEKKDSQYQPIIPIPVAEKYRVSFGQKRIYILHNMQENPTAYNIYDTFIIHEDIDLDAFKLALDFVYHRHSSFRTTFSIEGEELYQKLHSDGSFSFEYRDLTSSEFSTSKINQQINDYCSVPFDLEKGPLAKISLIKVHEREYKLIFVMHHIIADGHSINLIVNELIRLYLSNKNSGDFKESHLKLNYVDYAEWQHQLFKSPIFKEHEKYWLSTCKDLNVCEIKGDQPRPKVFNFKGNRRTFNIDSKVRKRFGVIAKEKQCTLFMLFLAAINILIYRFSGATDIIVGSPVLGRSHSDLKNIVGFFVNTIVLKNTLSLDQSISQLIQKIKTVVSEALEHQDYPFDLLVDKLNLQRDTSRSPVFNINMAFQNFELDDESKTLFQSLGMKRSESQHDSCKWDLEFEFLRQFDGEVICNVEYYSEIYSEKMISSIIEALKETLETIAYNTTLNLSQIKSSQNLSILFGKTDHSTHLDIPIHEIFESKAVEVPNAIAVKGKGISLTYSELNELANRVACFLETLKVSQGARVGVLCKSNQYAIIAVLGILKSGAAYVPIDPLTPENRICSVLEESQISILLSECQFIKLLDNLLWLTPILSTYLLLDTSDISEFAVAQQSDLMDSELWDQVSDENENAITSSGWVSSYTGLPFTSQEMEEYSTNVKIKLQPFINSESEILEIGCGSGLTTFTIAPQVKHYFATDLSVGILDKNKAKAQQEGHKNLKFELLRADQIDSVQGKFDIVIMNSVAHCFPSLAYFRESIQKAATLLKEGGVIFLGDLMDLGTKDDMVNSLREYKKNSQDKGSRTKIQWNNELFIPRKFLEQLQHSIPELTQIEISQKIGTISNELTKFRFDALFQVCKSKKKKHSLPSLQHLKKAYDASNLTPFTNKSVRQSSSQDAEAYVIFTSGSTGIPKGVVITHKSLVNYITWASNHYKMRNLNFLFFTSLAFDLTVTSLFTPLVNGNFIYIGDSSKDFNTVLDELEFLDDELIIKLTPSHLSILLEREAPPTCFKQYILGGEALPNSMVKKLVKKSSFPVHIYNEYGPTEATVGCITYACEKSTQNDGAALIGTPITNTFAAICDRFLNFIPIGGVGEIVIGGGCLAKHYLNNPRLTETKFVFNSGLQKSLYRTGDLGRLLPNGNMECFGRIDRQAKINGQRVELDEIEHWIQQQPAISGAVVTLQKNQMGNQVLSAYYSCKQPVSLEDIQLYLMGKVSSHMVPSFFKRIDAIPIASSGKVDYSRLPQQDDNHERTVVAPRNHIEKELLEIWSELLNIPVSNLSIEDNFFDLGGDSIIAMRIMPRLKKLGIVLKLTDIFQYPSIAAVSEFLSKKNIKTEEENITQSKKVTNGLVPLTPIQHWYRELKLPHPEFFNMVYMFKVRDDIDVSLLKEAILRCCNIHSSFRLKYESLNQKITQSYVPFSELSVNIENIDFSQLDCVDQEEKILVESERIQSSFNLSCPPLLKAAIFDLGKKGKRLFLVIHHLIVDGVSWRFLIEDLVLAYQSKLPESRKEICTLQDWSQYLHKKAKGVSEGIEYWLQLNPEQFHTISNNKRENWESKLYSEKLLTLSNQNTLQLIYLCNKLKCNVNEILLATLVLSYYKVWNKPQALVHHEGHGRCQDDEIDNVETVGWFTTIYPLCIEIRNDGELESTLQSVQETLQVTKGLDINYSIARYLNNHQHLSQLRPEILLNYFGRIDHNLLNNNLLSANFNENLGPTTHPDNPMPHLIEINAIMIEDNLRISFIYHSKILSSKIIKQFISEYETTLFQYLSLGAISWSGADR